ncbi:MULTISPECIES: alpha/beta fold hydrolase [unclassified Crossiella]|uniref:alpha/beta fold hydrolase n=1 Tax=unclassified Crossiella TaxID=2620835 RepID=UPI001FFF7461|nr:MULTISPECIES: alpha/beta fold hydrolase [unclassified Crossiella]MCK2241318.1 alpha/beta hydrolase [Crossiella sp. S99.2]MCK2253538.1 alpha/beta hydrolase [Crossiella sp. S99.1]
MIAVKLVAAALAAAVLAPMPAAAAQPTAESASALNPKPAPIAWQPCAEPDFKGLDCGTMRVPVDWSRPRAGEISLSLIRRKADEPARRIGSLLLNNGGGGSSIEQLRYAIRFGFVSQLPVGKRFDLVAVDPRGVGHSTPTTCANRPERAPGVTYFPANEQQYRALVENNRALAAACENQQLLANVDLASTARDMEAVRIGLGEKQLNWYGIHYSTLLGKTYAQLFPGRLRTLFADSALDDGQSPVARLAAEISTAEQSFNRFADWCRTDSQCALSGQDVAGLFDRLVADADRRPIPTKDPRRSLNGEDIRSAMQDFLNIKFPQWPETAKAIKQAVDGDATAFTVVQDKTLNRVQALTRACLDTAPAATGYAELAQLARMAKQLSPHLGGAVQGWSHLAGCQGWPVRTKQPVTAPLRDLPPALIVQSTHQSSAAYQWGFGLSARLPGSVVLSREGEDYSMILFSDCVREAMDTYLTERRLPTPGALCTN